MNSTKLIIFPQSYPFAGGDQVFLANELFELAKHFSKIIIVHFSEKDGDRIPMPQNVELKILSNAKMSPNHQIVLQASLYKLIWSEFRRLKISVFLKYFKFIIATYKKNYTSILALKQNNLLMPNALYYSFWMNDAALMLALAKRKGLIDKFIFRLHGFDLFEEIRPDRHIPFRDFNFKYVSKAFTVSQFGYKYLLPKLKEPNKLRNAYLGTLDRGINPLSTEKHVLVSCSSLNINKRVKLIVDSLAQINDLDIQWFHFGGRGDLNLNEFKKYALEKLPSNINFIAMGQIENGNLMEFYRSQPISAFIHLSATEGGPSIACQEAMSFGIPILASTAGGLKESINNKTGLPLTENPTLNEVISGIKLVLSPKFQNFDFRQGVREYWKTNFDNRLTSKIFVESLFQFY